MIKGIDHFAVVTGDIERARCFYVDLLGFCETMRLETTHSGTIVFISLDGAQLEVFGGGRPKGSQAEGRQVGYTHIALAVDDIDADYERLSRAGVQFSMRPTTVESGLRIAFFTDPDGNSLELMQRPA